MAADVDTAKDVEMPDSSGETKKEGDAAMADAPATTEAEGAAEPAADPGPSPEERVLLAEADKEAGNGLLKAGDIAGAIARYEDGINLTKPLLDKSPEEAGGEELQRRGVAVHMALSLNCAQACIKQCSWVLATEHASQVLLLDKDNAKALFRRGVAALHLDTEGRVEEARLDFTRVAQLDPSNREAREHLLKTKERLKELRLREKERLSAAMRGGLYQEQHDKLGRQQAAYEEEVKRRKVAGEDDITFEAWLKKEKEREDEQKKKQKDEFEKQQEEARLEEEKKGLEAENSRRAAEGQEAISLEEWREQQRAGRPRLEEDIVRTESADLDEEERKILQEAKAKGYYHGRLGTVLSDAAPKPQQVSISGKPNGLNEDATHAGSEWNQGGTWEEKDMTAWVKEQLTNYLQQAASSIPEAPLSSGASASASVKVTKVNSISGDAQIVMVRKLPRHGFNFEAELAVRLALSSTAEGASEQTVSGVLRLPELMDAVAPQDLKVDVAWEGRGPPEELRAAAVACIDKFRQSVRDQVASFRAAYYEKR